MTNSLTLLLCTYVACSQAYMCLCACVHVIACSQANFPCSFVSIFHFALRFVSFHFISTQLVCVYAKALCVSSDSKWICAHYVFVHCTHATLLLLLLLHGMHIMQSQSIMRSMNFILPTHTHTLTSVHFTAFSSSQAFCRLCLRLMANKVKCENSEQQQSEAVKTCTHTRILSMWK